MSDLATAWAEKRRAAGLAVAPPAEWSVKPVAVVRSIDVAPKHSKATDAEIAGRAERLVLSVAGAVSKWRGLDADTRHLVRGELSQLEALLGIAYVALPAPAPIKGSIARRAWDGFAPPPDDAQDTAALACWAALGEPVEAHMLAWRAIMGVCS